MAIKIGISGFGRISRLAIRSAMNMPDIEIAGINYRNADLDYLVYMLKYDSVFGRFPKEVGKYENGLVIDAAAARILTDRGIELRLSPSGQRLSFGWQCVERAVERETCVEFFHSGGNLLRIPKRAIADFEEFRRVVDGNMKKD